MLSYHHILCHPPLFLPSIFPSIRVFSIESALHISWPKYWSFSFSISPSTECSGLISFRIDWFDLLAALRTLKNLFQHHNLERINSLVLSLLYGPTLTTIHDYIHIALTIWTFVSKVMSLLFNTLSRFVIVFLPRSKHLFISWLKPLSTVILEPNKRKCVTVSTFSSSCHEVMALDAMVFIFWMLSFKPAFSLSSFILIKRFFSSSLLSAIRVVSSAYLRSLFLPAILISAWHFTWCSLHIH